MQGIDNLPKGGGSSTLSGLADVNFSSLTEGDLLIYDGAEWINHSFTEGHDILNESGTAVTARENLQFTDGLKVTDDSGNNKTKVGVNTTFTEASTRANINSGDTFSTILGKIKKFFTDLKAVAFSGSYNDLSNKPTIPTNTSDLNNDSGYVTALDLMDKVDKSGDTMSGNLSIENEGNESVLTLGTNQPALTPQASSGRIDLWSAPLNNAYKTSLRSGATTANRTITFPDDGGTVALITDVATKVSKSGDTMSGRLTVKSASGDSYAIVADRNHSSTTSTNVTAIIGNDIADGTAGSTYGVLRLYGKGSKRTEISAPNSTGHRSIELPDSSGTLALKEDLLTDSFTPVGANSTSQAIYQLHGSLSDNQKCSCLVNYGTTELFVTGYRKNSVRGRYVALGRTNEDILAFRVYGNTVSQNVISGTITTETIS